MVKIQLNKKKGVQGFFAFIDQEFSDKVNQHNWSLSNHKHLQYAITTIIIKGKRKTILLHRLIMGVTDPKILVDHKDRIGLNCLGSNLRLATRSQNNMNKKSTGISIYIGVSPYLDKRNKILESKWQSSIRINGIKKSLGRFNTQEEAARAYDIAANFYHKEFANLNFKEDKEVYLNTTPPVHERIVNRSSVFFGVSKYMVCYKSKKTGIIRYYDKWIAQIKVQSKHKYIGLFKTEKEAAIAYDKAAISYGQFANLNFPI